jgi:hypothetical protein
MDMQRWMQIMVAQILPFQDERASQSQKILTYMLAGNRINPLLALEMFGCFRLGGRRYDLVKAGWNVQTEMVKRNGKRFAEYRIDPTHPRLE